jgi:hypothetical protein
MTLRQKSEWKTKREVKETALTQPLPPRSGLVQPSSQAEMKQRLAKAAEVLLPDYQAGGDLTAFTVLDSEDFCEKR